MKLGRPVAVVAAASREFTAVRHLRQCGVRREVTMIYSSACSYAIRALAWLALKRPDGYMLLDEICAGTDLPRHFLAKIFQDLARRGLVHSAKGRGGGFALARPADEIRLLEVVEIIDGSSALQQCVVGMAQCDDNQPCPEHDHWKPIRRQIRDYLERTTLERMAHTVQRKLEMLGRETMTDPAKPAPEPSAKKPAK